MNPSNNPVALVGGNQRGLETLAQLLERNHFDSVLVIEPDQRALIYHLKEYGFAFSDEFQIDLTSRLSDLKTLPGLRQIIDASGNPNLHRDLYHLRTGAEIIRDSVFQLLQTLAQFTEKGQGNMASRQSFLLDHFEDSIREIDLASDEEEFYRYILDCTILATGAEGGELYLLEEDEKRLFLAMQREKGLAPKWHPPEILLKGGKGVVSKVARSTYPVILPNGDTTPWEEEILESEEVTSLMAVPILSDGDLLGVISLYRVSDLKRFTDQDLSFLKKLFPLLVKPIKKLLTLKDIRETSLGEALRKEIRDLMESKLSIQQKLQQTLEKITGAMSSLRGSLYVKDPYSDDLVLQASTQYSPQMVGLLRVQQGQGLVGKTAQVNHPFFLKQDPFSVLPPLQEIGACPASFTLPISTATGIVGIMELGFDHLERLPLRTLKLGKELCEILAIAIASDVERHRMSQKVLKLTVVNEEGLELLSTNDRDKVLRFATASAAMILEAEAVVLRIQDPKGKGLLVGSTYGLHKDEVDQQLVELDRMIATKVFDSKKTLSIPNLEDSEFSCPEGFPYRSVLTTVLLDQNQPLGTISVYNKLMYNSFSCTSFHQDDEEILQKFANYVGKSLLQAQEFKNRQALITIDESTGLKNKRYLELRLPEEIQRADRYQRNLTLIFLEVEGVEESFRQLSSGAKKELLGRVAGIIRETFRNVDIIVRLEKIKFAILMPDTGERALEAITRLIKNVSVVKIKSLSSGKVSPLRILVGHSNFPEDAKEPEDLLEKASCMKPID